MLTIGPGDTDSVRISMNQVVKHRGRYYGYYNGQGRWPEWSVHVAVSDDLLRWRKYPGNPILPLRDDKSSSALVPTGGAEGAFRLYTMDRRIDVHLP